MTDRSAIVAVRVWFRCQCGAIDKMTYETQEDIAKLDSPLWSRDAALCGECAGRLQDEYMAALEKSPDSLQSHDAGLHHAGLHDRSMMLERLARLEKTRRKMEYTLIGERWADEAHQETFRSVLAEIDELLSILFPGGD